MNPSAPQTLPAVLARHARMRPDSVALICGQRRVSYASLHARSNRTAHALRAAGAARGSRVGYLGRESEHYYDIVFGCAKSEAVLVPVNWRLTADEVEHILRDSGTEVLFVESAFAPTASEVAGRLPALREVVVVDADGEPGAGLAQWRAGAPDDEPAVAAGPDDPVAQIYTSGTTGRPKGAVLPHRSFFAIRDELAAAGLDWIDWRPDDVNLVGVPGFHIGGLWWAMQGFSAGVPNVVIRSFVSAEVVELIRTHGVTTTCLVPAMLQMVLAEPGVTPADFATLRKVMYGGSPIAEPLLRRCLDVMGCQFAQFYGLTETGNTAVCLPPADHVVGDPRMAAAGRPYPGVEVKVVGPDGGVLPEREVGEVCVRTPARMLGYWNLPEATASTLVDGWVRTGDAGYLDEDGYLFICDRIKDTIIVAGENVYPAEIEKALVRHEAVVEAAVVGVPHEQWGETVHAFVVCRPDSGVSRRQLSVFLRRHVADFKIPTSYDFVEQLPRNASGKILRRTLRDAFWRDRERQVN